MFRAAWVLFKRDIQLVIKDRMECFLVLMFQATVVGIFPLALSDLKVLPSVAIAYSWVSLLLAMLLGTDLLFKKDAEDGSLAFLRQSATPFWLLVFAKVWAHFVCTALPLILFSPVYALLLGVQVSQLLPMMAHLFLGALAMSAILSLSAAFSLLAQSGAALQVLIVLPLMSPVMILGPQAMHNPGAMYGLLALATLFLSILPVLSAYILDECYES